MPNVTIKKVESFKFDGGGTSIGSYDGQDYHYWAHEPYPEVPLQLAIELELEKPKRFEMVDKKLLNYLKDKLAKFMGNVCKAQPEPIKEPVKKPTIETDVMVNFEEIDRIKGIGPETLEDIKSLFNVAKSNKFLIDLILTGGVLPLRNDIVKKLRTYFESKKVK